MSRSGSVTGNVSAPGTSTAIIRTRCHRYLRYHDDCRVLAKCTGRRGLLRKLFALPWLPSWNHLFRIIVIAPYLSADVVFVTAAPNAVSRMRSISNGVLDCSLMVQSSELVSRVVAPTGVKDENTTRATLTCVTQ